MVFRWDLKFAEGRELIKGHEALEAMCMAWKSKVEFFKTSTNIVEHKEQRNKIASHNEINVSMKVNKEHS